MEMTKTQMALSAILVAELFATTAVFAAASAAGGSGSTGGPSTVVAAQAQGARKASERASRVIAVPARAHNFVDDEGNRRNMTVITDQPTQAASGAGAHRPQSMGVSAG
jgi:hypothetical protein